MMRTLILIALITSKGNLHPIFQNLSLTCLGSLPYRTKERDSMLTVNLMVSRESPSSSLLTDDFPTWAEAKSTSKIHQNREMNYLKRMFAHLSVSICTDIPVDELSDVFKCKLTSCLCETCPRLLASPKFSSGIFRSIIRSSWLSSTCRQAGSRLATDSNETQLLNSNIQNNYNIPLKVNTLNLLRRSGGGSKM